MFSRLQAANFKCLTSVDIALNPFNILIGPNASGKSSLLDCLALVRDAIETDVEKATRKRATTLRELAWKNTILPQGIQIALEAPLPHALLTNGYDHIRYEIGIGLDANGAIAVTGETLWLVETPQRKGSPHIHQPAIFPVEPTPMPSLVHRAHTKTPSGHRLVLRKVAESGNDYFQSEKTNWNIMLRLSPQRLALSGVPEDPERFPLALWFKHAMLNQIHVLQLNSVLMRRTCPADAPRTFQPDGSNLPIMVKELQRNSQRFEWWIQHLQTIIKDLEQVTVAERPEDRSTYLVATYNNGVAVPAWLLSDGTLRLLALTLIAYLPHQNQVFIIEEPENGIHPQAVESLYKALNSVYDGQIFMATHSPLVLALAQPENLLIFAKTPSGATAVINGRDHPLMRQWQRETPLETLFAAGVLG